MFQMTPKHSLPVPAAPVEPVQTTIVLHGLIAGLESLVQTHPHLATATAYQAALETQQLDHSAQQAAEEEVADTLDKYASDHPRTGPLHVYLLGNPGAASFDQDHETTPMKALVNASLRRKDKVVAALMPEDETVFQVADIPPSLTLRQLADTVLAQESIPTIVGKTAFEAFLKDPSSVFSLATEGVGGAILGAIVAPFIIAGIMASFKGKADRKKEESIEKSVAELKASLQRTYLNAGWLNAQTFKSGAVAGADISQHLVVAGKIPTTPAAAIASTVSKTESWLKVYVPAVETYAKELRSLYDRYIVDTKMATTFALKLKGLTHPLSKVPFPTHQLLGDLVDEAHVTPGGAQAGDWVTLAVTPAFKQETLPALTKDEAHRVAQAMVPLFELLPLIEEADAKIDQAMELFPDASDFPEAWEDDDGVITGYYYRRNRDLNAILYGSDGLGAELTKSIAAFGVWLERSIEKTKA